jgi:hypothetical protein
MAGVVPAWKIAEIFEGEGLMTFLKSEDDKISARRRESTASLDSQEREPEKGERVFTQVDFEDALRKASRRTEKAI